MNPATLITARNLPTLRALQRVKSDEINDWNIKKGPEPGLRWRTGQPPTPPTWRYDPNDLRAFAKFQKKVQIWQIQMEQYASKRDQALMLYGWLTGDAEQELEHLSIEEVHTDDGISLILVLWQQKPAPEMRAVTGPTTSTS